MEVSFLCLLCPKGHEHAREVFPLNEGAAGLGYAVLLFVWFWVISPILLESYDCRILSRIGAAEPTSFTFLLYFIPPISLFM
jgi:hypothetical protein